jgi:hypothetical protein
VPDPELYSWYSAEEAVSFFGLSDNGQYLCDGQWVIFPRAAICLAEIDKAEQKSYFQNGARFCWVADKPYQVSDAPMARFVPPQVTAPRGKEYSIRLFARPPRSEKYLYAGELEPSYVMQFSPHVNRGLSCYYLTPTLPSRIWLELGGLRLGDLDVATVDQALDRLRQPTTVQDRLDVLQQLVNFWHGPIRPEDGMSEMELGSVPLPLPLRFWYRWAGKRADVMTGQISCSRRAITETNTGCSRSSRAVFISISRIKACTNGPRCPMATIRPSMAATNAEGGGSRRKSRSLSS